MRVFKKLIFVSSLCLALLVVIEPVCNGEASAQECEFPTYKETITLQTYESTKANLSKTKWIDTAIVDNVIKRYNKFFDLTCTPCKLIKNYDTDVVVVLITVLDKKNNKVTRVHKILHRETKDKFTTYVLGQKRFILIDLNRGYPTGYNAEIVKKKSAFIESFEALADLQEIINPLGIAVKDSGAIKAIDSSKWNCEVTIIDKKTIDPPCVVKLEERSYFPLKSPWSTEIEVHEKNVALFKVGIAGFSLDSKNFKIENGQLAISVDSAQKNELASNLFIGLELHPPRDVDRYSPFISWKNRLKISNPLKKIGLFTGFRLSSQPFNSLYFGLTFDLLPGVGIMGGISAQRVFIDSVESNGTISVGDIVDLEDAKQSAEKKVRMGALLWHNAFACSNCTGCWPKKIKEVKLDLEVYKLIQGTKYQN